MSNNPRRFAATSPPWTSDSVHCQGQPGEVPELDQLGFDQVLGRQLIQGDEIFARLRGVRQVRLEIMSNQAAAVSGGLFPASLIDEDAPHGLGSGSEEMAAVLPARGGVRFDEPQIRLMHESCRVQGVAGGLVHHARGGELPQLVVDEREQVGRGLAVAGCGGVQKESHVGLYWILQRLPFAWPIFLLQAFFGRLSAFVARRHDERTEILAQFPERRLVGIHHMPGFIVTHRHSIH